MFSVRVSSLVSSSCLARLSGSLWSATGSAVATRTLVTPAAMTAAAAASFTPGTNVLNQPSTSMLIGRGFATASKRGSSIFKKKKSTVVSKKKKKSVAATKPKKVKKKMTATIAKSTRKQLARQRQRERAHERALAKKERLAAQRLAKRERTERLTSERRAKALQRRQLQSERRAIKKEKLRDHKREIRIRRQARSAATLARAKLIAEKRHQRLAAFAARHPKSRKQRNPAAPVPPMNIYSQFLKERFQASKAKLQAAGGKVTVGDVSKAVAAEWKNLSPDVKTRLQQDHATRRAAYEKAMAEFQKTLPPKRPHSAYIRFFTDVHGRIQRANPSAKMSEVTRLIGQEWTKLPGTEKAAYEQKALAELDSWKKSVDAWKATHKDEPTGVTQRRRVPSVTELTKQVVTKLRAKKSKPSTTRSNKK